MADKITFANVQLYDVHRKPSGGVAFFSCPVSAAIAKTMEWADIPTCAKGADMEGELVTQVVQITPNAKELEKHAVDLDAHKISKFVRMPNATRRGAKSSDFRCTLATQRAPVSAKSTCRLAARAGLSPTTRSRRNRPSCLARPMPKRRQTSSSCNERS